jgi:hypothetical protein
MKCRMQNAECRMQNQNRSSATVQLELSFFTELHAHIAFLMTFRKVRFLL